MISKFRAYAALALMLAMAPVVSADEIVYDNTSRFGGGAGINSNNAEVGDGVTLAGSERMVTKISLLISSSAQTADARVRLYEGGDDKQGEPGAMLWESELFEQMALLGGRHLYDFVVPNTLVPDSVTWTLELSAPEPVGFAFMGPATVGSSANFFWFHSPNGPWYRQHTQWSNSFGARIEAVPEPATLSLLAFAALGLTWRRQTRVNAIPS